MNRWYRAMTLIAATAMALFLIAGCATHERRQVTTVEEQQQGQVVEEQPGEMIVE